MINIYKIILVLSIVAIFYSDIFGYGDIPPQKPTLIKTSAFITDIQSLDEMNEQLQIDVIFRFSWNDQRLEFDKMKKNSI